MDRLDDQPRYDSASQGEAAQEILERIAEDLQKAGLGVSDISRVGLEAHVKSFFESVREAPPYVALSRPVTLVLAVASEGVDLNPVLLLPLGTLECPAQWGATTDPGQRTYRYISREANGAE